MNLQKTTTRRQQERKKEPKKASFGAAIWEPLIAYGCLVCLSICKRQTIITSGEE